MRKLFTLSFLLLLLPFVAAYEMYGLHVYKVIPGNGDAFILINKELLDFGMCPGGNVTACPIIPDMITYDLFYTEDGMVYYLGNFIDEPKIYRTSEGWTLILPRFKKTPLIYIFNGTCIRRSNTSTTIPTPIQADTSTVPDKLYPIIKNFTWPYSTMRAVNLSNALLIYPSNSFVIYINSSNTLVFTKSYKKPVFLKKVPPFRIFYYSQGNLKAIPLYVIMDAGDGASFSKTFAVPIDSRNTNVFNFPSCLFGHTLTPKISSVIEKNSATKTNRSLTSSSFPQNDEKICGVGVLFALSLLPLVLRRVKNG